MFIYLLLASVKPPLFGLARLGDSPTFLCSRENDYPFRIAWLGLPAGYVKTERKYVAIVGFTRSIDSLRVFLFLLEVENVNSIPSPSTSRFLFRLAAASLLRVNN